MVVGHYFCFVCRWRIDQDKTNQARKWDIIQLLIYFSDFIKKRAVKKNSQVQATKVFLKPSHAIYVKTAELKARFGKKKLSNIGPRYYLDGHE